MPLCIPKRENSKVPSIGSVLRNRPFEKASALSPPQVRVRSDMSPGSTALAAKEQGEVVRGREEYDGWLTLIDEPGLRTRSEHELQT